MAEVKVTIKEQFVEVAKVLGEVGRADLAEFIEGRIEVLDRKSANKKASAKQIENVGIKDVIVDTLATFEEPVKVSDLVKADALAQYTVPKVSALLKQLRDEGRVVRETNGKTPLYSVAKAE